MRPVRFERLTAWSTPFSARRTDAQLFPGTDPEAAGEPERSGSLDRVPRDHIPKQNLYHLVKPSGASLHRLTTSGSTTRCSASRRSPAYLEIDPVCALVGGPSVGRSHVLAACVAVAILKWHDYVVAGRDA